MACDDSTRHIPPSPSVPWRTTLEAPRGARKSWYVRCRRTINGRKEDERISTGCDNEADARVEMQKIAAKLNGTALRADPTILEIFDARIRQDEITGRVKRGTHNNYRTCRNALALIPLASVRVSELSKGDLRAAQRDLLIDPDGERRAPRTVNGWLRFVKAAYNAAIDDESIENKPFPKVSKLDDSIPTLPKRAYEIHEVDAVLADLRQNDPVWYLPLLVHAVTTGRIGETLSLRVCDVMPSSGVAYVRAGEGIKTGSKEIGLPASVIRALALDGRDSESFLFPSRKKNGHVLPSSALRALRRSLARLKIADSHELDVHGFRASGAAHGLDAGIAPHEVMAQGGWRDERVFMGYARKSRPKKSKTAETLHAYRASVLGHELGMGDDDQGDDDQGQGARTDDPKTSPGGSGATPDLPTDLTTGGVTTPANPMGDNGSDTRRGIRALPLPAELTPIAVSSSLLPLVGNPGVSSGLDGSQGINGAVNPKTALLVEMATAAAASAIRALLADSSVRALIESA